MTTITAITANENLEFEIFMKSREFGFVSFFYPKNA